MINVSQRLRSTPALIVAGFALLGIGGAIGATAASSMEHTAIMANATPTPIKSLADAARPWIGEPVVTVKGRVTQVFGRQFILSDGTGQVLVDAGGRGEWEGGIAANQVLTVQGGYDHGTLRPSYLIGADGRVAALDAHRRHHRNEDLDHGFRDGARVAEKTNSSPAQGVNATVPVSTGDAAAEAIKPKD